MDGAPRVAGLSSRTLLLEAFIEMKRARRCVGRAQKASLPSPALRRRGTNMTLEQLDALCRDREANQRKHNLDPGAAHVVLTRPGWPKGSTGNLVPGIKGRVVGTDKRPDGTKFCVLDVLVGDIRRYLTKQGFPSV